MSNFIPGLVIGFREGLEAFLIIAIMLRYLRKAKKNEYQKNVWFGVGLGVVLSLLIGLILYLISNQLNQVDAVAKLWESGASFFALVLVTTFIIWMIKNGSNMTSDIENKMNVALSGGGITLLAFAMVAREGVEIAIFTYAGSYSLIAILTGLLLSLVLTVLVFYSLVKVNLRTIFNVTMIYLILQAGFLFGYGIHEGLSAMKTLGYLSESNVLFTKLFDLSGTVLNHKEGWLGVPLYALIGWYSKPEIIQFVIQYGYTFTMLWFYVRELKKNQRKEG